MRSFSNDSDILRHETVLFGDLYLRGQVIASGAGGVVSGTRLTASTASFVSSGVEAGCVIFLNNAASAISGAFEVVSVDSATQLTVSVIRAERGGAARTPPAATEVSWRVCSYAPQANDVFMRLCAHFGITTQEAGTIEDVSTLRQAEVYLTIATVFAALATREGFAKGYLDKSERYTTLFLGALERCRFKVKVGGRTETMTGSGMELRRV